ncbi:hypothetical protein Q5424_27255, partial [Conexibacter sp. JD483]
AADGATWHFAPAAAPPPPAGVAPSPFPAQLGTVGDIEFWAPNRGLLISGGNQFVPAGLYAWDGVSWHQLSTVCGSPKGRIAWAGPDEFWTISDQRPGQAGGAFGPAQFERVSLCHFAGGRVVGSYALPLGQQDSYQPLNAAACRAPDDCWFGGERAVGGGGFHLHWDGSSVTAVVSPQDQPIAAMATFLGRVYESVRLGQADAGAAEAPALLHALVPDDPDGLFRPLRPISDDCPGGFCPQLPSYGRDAAGRPVEPATLDGLVLSGDRAAPGAGGQLWALAPANGATSVPAGRGAGHPLVLRQHDDAWQQVVPDAAQLAADDDPRAIAAEPGADAAWLTLRSSDGVAHVARLSSADAGATWTVGARALLGPDQQVGARGAAGPLACPAPDDCWLATDRGWLFHLTDGTPLARDSDPAFAGVIDDRPPDNGVPAIVPDVDATNDTPVPAYPLLPIDPPTPDPPRTPRAKPLVSKVSRRIVPRTTRLRVTFTLAARAHVQLVALRKGKVVAKTRRRTLPKGRHTLQLRLQRARWPTKLDLRARRAR